MKKQALKITLEQLVRLKLELIEEIQASNKKLGFKDWKVVSYTKEILVPIINKKGLSDTWEFEKCDFTRRNH